MGLQSTPIQARTVLRGTTEPSDPNVLWLDEASTPATLRQYDPGASQWVPVASNPVAKKQVVETFGESFLSVTGGDVSGESLYPVAADRSQSLAVQIDTESSGSDSFTADLTYVSRLNGNLNDYPNDPDSAELRVDGTVEASISGGSTFPIDVDVSGYTGSVTVELRIQGGTGSGGIYNGYSGSLDLVPSMNGENISATLDLSEPRDVFGWDVITFDPETPGSTDVEVYVVEGGSEVAGPLRRGDSIPSDPSVNPSFRVDFISDTTLSNVPQINSFARRWKL